MELHPVQQPESRRECSYVRSEITLRAYEVCREIFGPQEALVSGDCRGGFSAGELIALLYARSFPENEWRKRWKEAIEGMRNL